MANILVKPFFLLRKRCYGVVVESIRLHKGSGTTVNANVRKSASTSTNGNAKKDEIFWMRDPKSGNWIPENHFGEVDAVDSRDKFLPKTHQTEPPNQVLFETNKLDQDLASERNAIHNQVFEDSLCSKREIIRINMHFLSLCSSVLNQFGV